MIFSFSFSANSANSAFISTLQNRSIIEEGIKQSYSIRKNAVERRKQDVKISADGQNVGNFGKIQNVDQTSLPAATYSSGSDANQERK